MRIGMVTGEYPPMQGGVGAYSRILAQTLARQGHEVRVLTSRAAHGHDAAVPTRAVIDRWGVGALRQVRAWARAERLDIVNVQFQTAAYGMSPWIHVLPDVLRAVPVVTTFHDLRFPYLFPKAGALRDWIVMHLARASDGVIVTNHEDAARLAHLPHVRMIPIGSNIAAAETSDGVDWRAQTGASPGDFLITFFGFLNQSKGVETLLDSLARLRADGVPARLVLIGGRVGSSDPTNAAYADRIDAQMMALGLEAFVQRTGFLDDAAVAQTLAASDVVALPFLDGASYRRGSLMAAIAHGCAIVTTTPVVPIDTFVDGDNMLLVPHNDALALAHALRRVYESPELRARLRAGASGLAAHFDWNHIAAATVEFFSQLTP